MTPMCPEGNDRLTRRGWWAVGARGVGAVAAAVLAAGGCASNDEGPVTVGGRPVPNPQAIKDAPPDSMLPLSDFDRAKLISRVRSDPRQLSKLTLRERRELARLMAATSKDEDKN